MVMRAYRCYQDPFFDLPITPLIFEYMLVDVSPPLQYKIKNIFGLLNDADYAQIKYDLSLQRIDKRHPFYVEVLFDPYLRETNGIKITFVTKPVIFFLINKRLISEDVLENENCYFILKSCDELVSNLIKSIGGNEIYLESTLKKQCSQTELIEKGERNLDKEKRNLEYDVALSFAGEERTYVKEVAEYLKEKGVKVFYDEDEEAEANMWGVDLTEYLYKIYAKEARYCVVFISKNYAEKIWTKHEKRSALERAIKEKREYILPARFDNTEIEGLQLTLKYIDAKKKTPKQLGDLVLKKLGSY